MVQESVQDIEKIQEGLREGGIVQESVEGRVNGL